MVLVKIDIKNIASETHPDDKVVFRSPVVREAAGGGLVSTADEVVSLVDGVGEVNLTPGPVIVTFQCRGMADTRPKRGTVPDSGPVTVVDVIGGNFTFTPEVVGAAQTARNQAVQAASDAEAAEEAAEGYAEAAGNASNAASGYTQEAKGYRDAAAGHAQTATDQASVATDKAGEANASSNTAGAHASAADTARQGAVAAQGLAETARDEAEAKVQAALDAALPTKADKVHTHTTAQVTGLDTALASKATQATLDTRVPAGLALRVDTTVGTRVFAGVTMIHGDTGWIHADLLMTPNFTLWNTGGTPPSAPDSNTFLRLKRVGNKVTLDGRIAASSVIAGTSRTGTKYLSDSIPMFGFRPHRDYILAGQYWCYATGERGVVRVHSGNIEMRESPGVWKQGELVIVHATWETESPWPTSLPGTPG